MYSVALRGYVLWIINMVITLYLFTQTFKIYDYNKLVESGATENTYINNAYKSDNINVQAAINNQAIRGYEKLSIHMLKTIKYLIWIFLDTHITDEGLIYFQNF